MCSVQRASLWVMHEKQSPPKRPGVTASSFVQFVADNADHNNIRTLDGSGTFHGMGIIPLTVGVHQEWTAPSSNSAHTSLAVSGRSTFCPTWRTNRHLCTTLAAYWRGLGVKLRMPKETQILSLSVWQFPVQLAKQQLFFGRTPICSVFIWCRWRQPAISTQIRTEGEKHKELNMLWMKSKLGP